MMTSILLAGNLILALWSMSYIIHWHSCTFELVRYHETSVNRVGLCICMHAHLKSWVGTSYDIRIQVSSDISWLMERGRLDRRRLEAAHMKYGVLSVASWCPCDLNPAEIAFSPDLEQTLLGYTPVF